MTGLLLDSHTLLWWALELEEVAGHSAQVLRSVDRLVLSVASIWELEIKAARKKLQIPEDLWGDLSELGIETLAITAFDAITAGRLPRHHDDPFDRMIIAQAINRGSTVVSRDPKFAWYDVFVLKP